MSDKPIDPGLELRIGKYEIQKQLGQGATGTVYLATDTFSGSEVALTATEFALLKAIAAQPRRAFTRENLMTAAYADARFVSDRTIDSHVRHIRAKFQAMGGDPIETVHGVGYKLAAL